MAGGGHINVTTTLLVDFIINSDKISVSRSVDNITGQCVSLHLLLRIPPQGF